MAIDGEHEIQAQISLTHHTRGGKMGVSCGLGNMSNSADSMCVETCHFDMKHFLPKNLVSLSNIITKVILLQYYLKKKKGN